MKKIGLALAVGAALFAVGCVNQIPVEDPVALTECADQIKVLQDPLIPANSEAKHAAATKLADHVDFTYARNVKTLLKFFSAADAHVSEDGGILVFSYPYREHDVQFRFRCSGTTIVTSDVLVK